MNADDDLAALRTVTSRLVTLIDSVEPDQWDRATPCPDWNLSALLDHVTGGNWFTTAILSGESAPDAMTATSERFHGGSAGSDVAIRALDDQVRAFTQADVLDRTCSHVTGELSGRQILRLRLHDLIVHSWDIEETLRPGVSLPDGLLRWALDEVDSDDSLTARHFGLDDVSGLRSTDERGSAYLAAFGR